MRILNLARELPFFPGGHGGNTRAFCLLRALSNRHDFTVVTNVYTKEQEEAVETLRKYVRQVEYYRDPGVDAADAGPQANAPAVPVRRGWRDSLRLLPGIGLTWLQRVAAGIYDRLRLLPAEARTGEATFENLRPAVQRALRGGPYDVLQIEYSENAGWVRRVPFRGVKLLVVHDVKTIVWWRRFRNARGWTRRLAALNETLRFWYFERRYSRRFDHLVAMSEVDREYLRRLTGHPSITVVPNGVDTSYYRPSAPRPVGKRIVFAATMNHPPNHDGILYFAREIFPRIRAAEPDAQLDIVGHDPPDDVRALAGDNVRVTGFVPDTRPYIDAARVFICPLRFASGTRLKVLEAMAMQRPVVSTSVGAEGIDCEPGRDILIADDPETFVNSVVQLLRDDDAAAKIGAAGRAIAMRYDWTAVAAPLDELYHTAHREQTRLRATRRPRIGLNALFLVPGGPTGGLEPYFHHLAKQLTRLDGDNDYVIIANSSNALEFTRLERDNLRCQVVDVSPLTAAARNAGRRALSGLLGRGMTGDKDPDATDLELDLIHCFPGYIDGYAWDVPAILTVADVQHEYHPEFFDQEELDARRALFRPSIEHALHIIAISEFTRRTILDKFDVAAEKVSVIPLGVDARFFAPVPPARIAEVRRKHGLPDDYCLYPANLWPHKNHPRLLDAWRELPPHKRPHLVLTGAQTRLHTPLRRLLEEKELTTHVSWLGFVDADDLPPLLAGARLMVFPSLFEGFGMPVVEAMAAGCPVTCAQTTSLPEVAGEAALFFDPTRVDSIAGAVDRLWNDGELRERLREAGSRQARRWSWQRTALQTLRLYRQLIGEQRSLLREGKAA